MEITGSEALVLLPLNDLHKESRPVLHWPGEDLQQLPIVVEIAENVELHEVRHVFLDSALAGI